VYVNTDWTANVCEERLARVLKDIIDLSPRGIREHLGLNRPIYGATGAYGHFGREPTAAGEFSWERLDLVDGLRSAFNA
jgi:S-adenosylmethionine synthetase